MAFANSFPIFLLMRIAYVFLLSANLSWAQSGNVTKPQPLHAEGIENFFKLSDNVYSGSTPEGEKSFAELQELGIKTIISVDGAKPDAKTAEKFGLRYVHIPIGYDSVPTNQALKLVKAARKLPKPIYVHCHHGLHRGPAGAAVICEGTENWTPNQAISWLKQAGTATNYAGLYKSVADFRSPSDEELKKLPGDFPEKIEVSPMVEAMVEIDDRFDHLKLIQKAGYQMPPAHPDLNPAHESLLLEELFRELNRSAETRKNNQNFQNQMAVAEKAATELRIAMELKQKQLSDADKTELSVAFDRMSKSCSACHKAHRN